MENVKFALKSTVQALDPACGIWLTGKITNLKEGEVLIKWKNYNTSDWIKESLVRFPLTKRKCQINLGDWKRLRPALYQKGEVVTIKKADGTSGENVVIEENDPFGCVMQGSNRKLKYEWLREAPEDVSVPVQVAAIQTPNPPRPPFQETVGSQKTAGPDVQRSPRATRTAPTASDIENQTPHNMETNAGNITQHRGHQRKRKRHS
ncbi:hypothetical protein BSL78_13229 [Apostichopus japonicus]|uniref:Uncharacterized protein n=1 Tax=Stichopus japonicus TaxID=307972 RepID=A0A2G8KPL0_STIJA|nr:hypothetical protein BSL78_13229 [Apostichopus japonicus]